MLDLPITERTFGGALFEQAARQGDRPFLLFDEVHYTYAEALLESRRIAGGLRNLGVSPRAACGRSMRTTPRLSRTLHAQTGCMIGGGCWGGL